MTLTKARILAGFLALGAANLGVAGRVPVVLVEGAVETTANELGLPASEQGIITVRSCAKCATQTFYFDKNRELILNGKPVSLAQMSAALRSSGNVPVTLHYRNKDKVVTRVVMMVLPKAPQ